ncbi:hypothetical protein JD844_014956 [Phrynosoma platyrhinos]|uniref:Sodium/calcium exchanger membrane region domain-containing protein n=1 Tax=Phrynosoma platyrhinos TaxID=52577 RepID=A0ABQ7T6S4_PHRPL|nr:hypothetical protein JD844_014956 [Phrynosoma platyrhinos]
MRTLWIFAVAWTLIGDAGAIRSLAGPRDAKNSTSLHLDSRGQSSRILDMGPQVDALWLLYLFVILGVTAEKFFCPNLSAISTKLKLAHNVASNGIGSTHQWIKCRFFLNSLFHGVTFLAFGNGAPDVFSAVVAFSDPRTAGLAIGALFGAGIFVTTIVAGGIALVRPFTAASRPFLRDAIFYMVAVFLTFVALYFEEISLGEALKLPTDSEDGDASSATGGDYGEEYQPLLPSEESTFQILTHSLNPLDYRKWRRKPCYWRLIKACKLPIELVLLLTVPVVDPDREDQNWKRPLNCLHLITGPLICVLTLKSGMYGLYKIQGFFPVWGVVILVAAAVAVIIFCTTKNEEPPRYHWLESEGLLVWILAGALGLSLVFSFLSVPAQCFHLGRGYGCCLIVYYLLFLTVALLTEFRVIRLSTS